MRVYSVFYCHLCEYSWIMIVVGFLFLNGCVMNSKTTYIKTPLPEYEKVQIEEITPSCLSMKRIKNEWNNLNNRQLTPLRRIYEKEDDKKALFDYMGDLFKKEELICDENGTPLYPSYPLHVVDKEVEKQEEGLFEGNREKKQTIDELRKRQLQNAFGIQNAVISVSPGRPGSLALSARPLPIDPGGVFAGLKERAQAEAIKYAAAFAKTTEKKPEEAVESLLKSLSPTPEPSFPATQRVELTISTAVNSASIFDRFDYISAYLGLPALPQCINARTSLEREFLQGFQMLNLGHMRADRNKFEKSDLLEALEYLRIKIESIDNLKTEPATVQLGTITSTRSLSLTGSASVATSFDLTSVNPSLSTTRTENINKELDKRSFWLDKNRTLLRIVQRGMQEATISGSFSSALTLRIPKTSLYVITISEEEIKKKPATTGDKKEKLIKVQLRDTEQPLYCSVRAAGVVLGTVRIATPTNDIIIQKREPDGIASTVIEAPVPINIWRNTRTMWTLDGPDLFPSNEEFQDIRFGIYSTGPYARQHAVFDNEETYKKFISTLLRKELKLIEHKIKATDEKGNDKFEWWYEVASTCSNKRQENLSEPEIGKIWLGRETNDGLSTGFDKKFPRDKYDICAQYDGKKRSTPNEGK